MRREDLETSCRFHGAVLLTKSMPKDGWQVLIPRDAVDNELEEALDQRPSFIVTLNKGLTSIMTLTPALFLPGRGKTVRTYIDQDGAWQIKGQTLGVWDRYQHPRSAAHMRVHLLFYFKHDGRLQIGRPTMQQMLDAPSTEPTNKPGRTRPSIFDL